MPRALRSSSLETKAQLSHAIDLFLHKNRTSFFDDDSIASGSIAPFDPQPALPEPSSFKWDLQTRSTPLIPAFKYISSKLHQHELSVALIVSDQDPYVIPVWPLPRKSQTILAQTIRKAVKKFSLQPGWLTALASAPSKCLPKIFDTHRPNSYIVRRSLVQHELIFSEEGLTLLGIDHIYTFKQLLCTLSKKNWVPHARDICLSSCVHLLQRINIVYTDPKVSKAYLERVYDEIEFQKESYDEVVAAYDVNYCTASIKDFTAIEPDYTALSDMALDYETDTEPELELEPASGSEPAFVAELPDSSAHTSNEETISPIATIDLSTTPMWQTPPPHAEESLDTVSPLTVRYPTIQKRLSEIVPESPLDPDAPWNCSAVPRPLNTRRASTLPRTTSITSSPSSPHEAEAEAYWSSNIPTPREITDPWISDIPSAPLQTFSPNRRSSEDPPNSPFDIVRSWVESWSTVAPRPLCERCHEVAAVQPLVPRRFTMA